MGEDTPGKEQGAWVRVASPRGTPKGTKTAAQETLELQTPSSYRPSLFSGKVSFALKKLGSSQLYKNLHFLEEISLALALGIGGQGRVYVCGGKGLQAETM